jgi:hypothetical protein
MNRVFHEYIRAYISQTHKDWDKHLYTAQFAINNSISEATGVSPAFLTFGFHPRNPHTQPFDPASGSTFRNPLAENFTAMMKHNMEVAKTCIQKAQYRMKQAYDKHHQEISFKVGDLVLLKSKNLTLPGKAKFLPRFVGPFPVTSLIGVNAYRVELPPDWGIHNVFNVSLLKQYKHSPGASLPVLPKILDDFSFVIHSIVAHRLTIPVDSGASPTLQYRLHFNDQPDDCDVWEYANTVKKAVPAMLLEYKLKHSLDAAPAGLLPQSPHHHQEAED